MDGANAGGASRAGAGDPLPDKALWRPKAPPTARGSCFGRPAGRRHGLQWRGPGPLSTPPPDDGNHHVTQAGHLPGGGGLQARSPVTATSQWSGVRSRSRRWAPWWSSSPSRLRRPRWRPRPPWRKSKGAPSPNVGPPHIGKRWGLNAAGVHWRSMGYFTGPALVQKWTCSATVLALHLRCRSTGVALLRLRPV